MTKIVLAAAAVLIGMGTAFAGSDNYGSANAGQSAASVDTIFTASVKKSDESIQKPVTQGSARDLFGNY